MGCHQNNNTPEGLYLYNGQSKLIGYSFDDSEGRVLPTYRYSDYGDVAYVKLDDYANILSKLGILLADIEEGDEGSGASEETLHGLIVNEAFRQDASVPVDYPLRRNGMLCVEQPVLLPPRQIAHFPAFEEILPFGKV